MGGMGQVIYDRGYEWGYERGMAQGILEMGLSAKLSTEEIADALVRQLQWTREEALAYVRKDGKSEQAPV